MRFYGQFVSPGDLCFDLGAHVGNRTKCWLALGARVISVEPQPICVRYLERTFASDPRFTLVDKAVGAKRGRARFQIAQLFPTISTLSDAWPETLQAFASKSIKWDATVEVEVVTLDDLIATYGQPQFCKIDVEDYEEQVLQGLSHPIAALSFEFFPTTLPKAVRCMDRLAQLGPYVYNWSLTESMDFQSTAWLSFDEMAKCITAYEGRKSGDIYARLTTN
jgi:FkbM family methyltransferase